MNLFEHADGQEQIARDERKTGGTKRGLAREPTMTERFEALMASRPDIYELMVKLARDVKGRGIEDYGMKAIFERARWHFRVERGEADFKLNNNYTAFYAREIMAREPDLDGFFKTRRRKSN